MTEQDTIPQNTMNENRTVDDASPLPSPHPPDVTALLKLVNQWEATVRSKFRCAAQEPEDFPRRFIEHGAVCYFNCARQLRDLIESRNGSLDLELQILEQDTERP